MNVNQLTVSGTGGALLGAGLTKLGDDIKVGLLLIGVGVLLQVLVAILNKEGIPVSAQQ